MAAAFGGKSFFSSADDDDDDDDDDREDDASANAFTFSLLGQLKNSLVTYDNSLKGFLDMGKAATAAAIGEPSATGAKDGAKAAAPDGKDGKDSKDDKAPPARDRLASVRLHSIVKASLGDKPYTILVPFCVCPWH